VLVLVQVLVQVLVLVLVVLAVVRARRQDSLIDTIVGVGKTLKRQAGLWWSKLASEKLQRKRFNCWSR
jgi:hypothetical protein